ncbi:uncharacterized protein LOC8283385 [Ricinus communis]|uniref:Uncharacterized protein n=1 Tax=Ricinus communis TaxID=3988 RepID=B9SH23_RICCO|nr:uncharacterized protein LOC8283385 [Ricinus communis]EEF37120.1 conserved hypothetical protein [Ricinus communis]|eukprot:XP_002525292.1 uncharacterized protein LOC8283385 [Ricinus communis]
MMRREERRRKFHKALLNTLYPPTQQPQDNDEEEKENPVITSSQDLDVNLIPDDYGLQQSSSSTNDNNGDSESEQQKLTRAQRKRLRKKMLKEDICRRGHIIGPLLPSSSNDIDDGTGAVKQDTPGVRQNADESPGNENSQKKKLKQRRMAKRLAKERLKSSEVENCVQGHSFD